jgi:hypothetical protein
LHKATSYGGDCEKGKELESEAEVTGQPNDKNKVEPKMEEIEKNPANTRRELSAGSGYWSEANVRLYSKIGSWMF